MTKPDFNMERSSPSMFTVVGSRINEDEQSSLKNLIFFLERSRTSFLSK